jgi:hypothetical protein
LDLDLNSLPDMNEPIVFVIYFRRGTGKYYIKLNDEYKEKYLIYVLLDIPYVK